MTSAKDSKMSNDADCADPRLMQYKIPPRAAMPEEIMKADTLRPSRFCPSVAAAAGLSFMATSLRP